MLARTLLTVLTAHTTASPCTNENSNVIALTVAENPPLEPEWEARFEPKSYGFRSGRGCHDAIEAIFNTACGKNAKRLWALDADLHAAFDQIAHDQLLRQIGTFPARGLIAQWLTAGVVEQGRFTPTLRGTPQGGVASPLLLNVALHGMEQAAGVRYYTDRDGNPVEAVRNVPIVVRYADDVPALCHSSDQAEQVKARLSTWLAPRGLVFNEDKTRVVHLEHGCDFLGYVERTVMPTRCAYPLGVLV